MNVSVKSNYSMVKILMTAGVATSYGCQNTQSGRNSSRNEPSLEQTTLI